jgi:hypothetical protein
MKAQFAMGRASATHLLAKFYFITDIHMSSYAN